MCFDVESSDIGYSGARSVTRASPLVNRASIARLVESLTAVNTSSRLCAELYSPIWVNISLQKNTCQRRFKTVWNENAGLDLVGTLRRGRNPRRDAENRRWRRF